VAWLAGAGENGELAAHCCGKELISRALLRVQDLKIDFS
jgi:hypothetical protein